VQHGLRSGGRERGGARAKLAACGGRGHAVDGMSAAAGCRYRRWGPRIEGAAARNGWSWRSAGVHVRSSRGCRSVGGVLGGWGCRSVGVGVRSGWGCRSIACAAGRGMGSVGGNPVRVPHAFPADRGAAGGMGCSRGARSIDVRGVGGGAR
jgi:hypothetical protein